MIMMALTGCVSEQPASAAKEEAATEAAVEEAAKEEVAQAVEECRLAHIGESDDSTL